ncbi:minor capsid protein [Streptomyces sp. LE64]|uniref:minor capsid protein n=1 Tax=Streptomyces sp. LE64 TaxID=3448653 RepID=UPI004042B80B
MGDVVDGIARFLAARGLVAYDPTGRTGDLFVGTMPAGPDAAVALTAYGTDTPTAPDDDDHRVRLQIRVRGGTDPRVSEARCRALRDALHGQAGVELPGGVWLVLATAPLPSPLGPDATGRHEHVTNAALDVAAPTTP